MPFSQRATTQFPQAVLRPQEVLQSRVSSSQNRTEETVPRQSCWGLGGLGVRERMEGIHNQLGAETVLVFLGDGVDVLLLSLEALRDTGDERRGGEEYGWRNSVDQ